jgi:hypothetical protein
MSAKAVLLLGGDGDGEIVTIPATWQDYNRPIETNGEFIKTEMYRILAVTDQFAGKPYHVGLAQGESDIMGRLLECYHEAKMEKKARRSITRA